MAGMKKHIVRLSDDEVAMLERIAADKNTRKFAVQRCRILLDLDENHGETLSHNQIAEKYAVSPTTVSVLARFYNEKGIHAVTRTDEECNPVRAVRKIDKNVEEAVVRLAKGPLPEGHCRWTIRLLAREASQKLTVSISREAVRKILKRANFDLADTFIASELVKQIVISDQKKACRSNR